MLFEVTSPNGMRSTFPPGDIKCVEELVAAEKGGAVQYLSQITTGTHRYQVNESYDALMVRVKKAWGVA